MAGPGGSTVRLDQYHWEDFSEFYSPANSHLTPGEALNSQVALCSPINPTLHLLQWIHRSKLRKEKCFSYDYNWKIKRYWVMILLWLKVIKRIFIVKEKLEIMGWAPVLPRSSPQGQCAERIQLFSAFDLWNSTFQPNWYRLFDIHKFTFVPW